MNIRVLRKAFPSDRAADEQIEMVHALVSPRLFALLHFRKLTSWGFWTSVKYPLHLSLNLFYFVLSLSNKKVRMLFTFSLSLSTTDLKLNTPVFIVPSADVSRIPKTYENGEQLESSLKQDSCAFH